MLQNLSTMALSSMKNSVLSRVTEDFNTFIPSVSVTLTPNRLKCMAILGITYCVGVFFIISFSTMFVTMPLVYEDSVEILTKGIWLLLFFIIGVLSNFYFIVMKRGFYDRQKCEQLGLLPDIRWQKCIDCQQLKPPRTHHCVMCGKCILKRDHHCFFTGTCIGFENQRYFIVFCFNVALGTAFCFYIDWQYLTLEHIHPSWSNFYHFILPVTVCEWLSGYSSFGFLYFCTLAWLCLCTCIGTTALFCWQFLLVIWGATTYEFVKGIRIYRMGVMNNIRSVFGPYWLVNFLVPMPVLKPQGNGMDWGSKLL